MGTSRIILYTYKVMLLTSLFLSNSLPTSMLSSTAIIVFDKNSLVALSLRNTRIVSPDDKSLYRGLEIILVHSQIKIKKFNDRSQSRTATSKLSSN